VFAISHERIRALRSPIRHILIRRTLVFIWGVSGVAMLPTMFNRVYEDKPPIPPVCKKVRSKWKIFYNLPLLVTGKRDGVAYSLFGCFMQRIHLGIRLIFSCNIFQVSPFGLDTFAILFEFFRFVVFHASISVYMAYGKCIIVTVIQFTHSDNKHVSSYPCRALPHPVQNEVFVHIQSK
jgi:hypothetical protein